MARNWIQHGDVITAPAPSGGLVTGQAVLIGSLFGVSAFAVPEGSEAELNVVGVWTLPNAGGALAFGAKAYWDGVAITGTASGNKLVGVVVRESGAGDATVRVRLDGTSV
jgi:predicted RecA/RadA family phage recombinase